MGKAILKEVERLQRGPLLKILLTHGHADHVGAIEKIVQETKVPVLAHRLEIPYMTGKVPYPGNKKSKEFVLDGMVLPRPMPWFTANMIEAIENGGQIVQQLKPEIVEITHGDAVYHAVDQIDDYLKKYKQKFANAPKKNAVE